MKIGIIGVGNIGATLARKLIAAGHDVRVANSKGPGGVRAFADEIGATAVDARGAVVDADLVILSIPLPAVETLAANLFEGIDASVPVVDTGNYYPGMRDPHIAPIDEGQPESAWVAEQIGRPVIKAFNNILAYSLAELGRPAGTPGRIGVTVAGDDAEAKRVVMELVDEVGFDAVDGGTLDESWRQQPATPGYCCDYDAETLRRGLRAAVKERAPQRRDDLSEQLMALQELPTHATIIALNRSFSAID